MLISEATETFSGLPKPLYYEENKDDYLTFAYIENQFTLDGSDEDAANIEDVKKKGSGIL